MSTTKKIVLWVAGVVLCVLVVATVVACIIVYSRSGNDTKADKTATTQATEAAKVKQAEKKAPVVPKPAPKAPIPVVEKQTPPVTVIVNCNECEKEKPAEKPVKVSAVEKPKKQVSPPPKPVLAEEPMYAPEVTYVEEPQPIVVQESAPQQQTVVVDRQEPAQIIVYDEAPPTAEFIVSAGVPVSTLSSSVFYSNGFYWGWDVGLGGFGVISDDVLIGRYRSCDHHSRWDWGHGYGYDEGWRSFDWNHSLRQTPVGGSVYNNISINTSIDGGNRSIGRLGGRDVRRDGDRAVERPSGGRPISFGQDTPIRDRTISRDATPITRSPERQVGSIRQVSSRGQTSPVRNVRQVAARQSVRQTMPAQNRQQIRQSARQMPSMKHAMSGQIRQSSRRQISAMPASHSVGRQSSASPARFSSKQGAMRQSRAMPQVRQARSVGHPSKGGSIGGGIRHRR